MASYGFWPSAGGDETFWSIPPFIPRPPFKGARRPGRVAPSPATAATAVAVATANLDVAGALAEHAQPRLKRTDYTRLNTWSAALLLKAELLALPSRFDEHRYSILAEAADLARDSPPTLDSGPAWYVALYAKDLATGNKVVLPVTSGSRGPLVETSYDDASKPGVTAYGFAGFVVQHRVPSKLSGWIRRVVAKRGWHPTNFH